MDEKIITIARFSDYIQANMAKISLEAEGIQCFLGGENFVATYGLYSIAVGGVELCIKESDKQQAEEILKNKIEIKASDPFISHNEEYDLKCPKCGSDNIDYEKYSRWAFFLSILMFRFPITYPSKKYTCQSCRHKWK